MRAVVCREFGPPERLAIEESPDPAAGDGQVVVRVRAAAVSFVDGLLVRGGYQIRPPLPFTPGMAVAGDVVQSGAGVSFPAAGDAVLALTMIGGYATHVVVPATAAVPMPTGLSYGAAASCIEGYGTMLFALTRRTSIAPGEIVLVLGAGGGIGLAAIDVARSLGARVIAAASSADKRAVALAAGAEAVIDTATEDLKARARQLSGGGVDMVVDPVGGELAEPALRTLRPFGRYLVLGFAAGTIPRLPANHVLLTNRSIVGVDWGDWARNDPEAGRALLTDLLARLARGELHPVEPRSYPLDEAALALAALAERRVAGKLVLVP